MDNLELFNYLSKRWSSFTSNKIMKWPSHRSYKTLIFEEETNAYPKKKSLGALSLEAAPPTLTRSSYTLRQACCGEQPLVEQSPPARVAVNTSNNTLMRSGLEVLEMNHSCIKHQASSSEKNSFKLQSTASSSKGT